uniref:Reverse transcriptase n=1 Tax=Tanacetum cinerariifolium TaxID=118510 RepID=A0A699HQF2_TANCI|nr:reverse transcriptase [Tanacetum cinerariifolium]
MVNTRNNILEVLVDVGVRKWYLQDHIGRSRSGEGSSGFSRISKLEFHKFSGDDVKRWMFRIKQLFSLDGIGVEEYLEEEEEESDMIAYELSDQTPQSLPYISLNALSRIPIHNTIRLKGHVFKQILHILMDSEYADVFEVPKELPPQRSFDHKIPLKEDNVAINIRTYRYPPNQKDSIKAIVKELLDSRVIRPSNSPFSSSIIIVKKKDGSWIMCIDYRQLNKKHENEANNALSRIKRQGVLFSLLAGTSNELMDVVVATWSCDSNLQAFIKGLQDKTLVNSKYVWQNDHIRRKDKWVVGKDLELRKKLIKHFYSSVVGGHSRVQATTKRLNTYLYWKGLRKMVKEWVDYKLKLPDYAKVHLAFHVSQLKPCYSDSATMGSFLLCDNEGLLAATPLKLLDKRMVKQNIRMVMFGLIQWSIGSEEDATWGVKLKDLLARFPEFTLYP